MNATTWRRVRLTATSSAAPSRGARINGIDTREALAAPGVVAVLTTLDHAEPLPLGMSNNTPLFGGSAVNHYHQAVACVVAETFEQARAAADLVRVDYARSKGVFDFPAVAPAAPLAKGRDDKPTAPRSATSRRPSPRPR
ncbi:hypothetical protein AB5I41_25140 [Sphingomonas sp. MMS24-JH45]